MIPMRDGMTIQDLVATHYADLTDGLRQAADYVVAHPIEVATRSLRSVAAASGLSPTTFSRLARALGMENHAQIRDLCRLSLTPQTATFAGKAQRLRSAADRSRGLGTLFYDQAAESLANIEELARRLDVARLERVVDRLGRSRRVTLLAGGTSRGLAGYVEEMAGWISARWVLAENRDVAQARAVIDAGPDESYLLISKSLFSAAPIRAARYAAERGAFVLVITDSHTCPALPFASEHFVLPTDSPHYFPSYAPTVVLLEAMMSMLAARIGGPAQDRIKAIESGSRTLGAYWE